MRLAWTRAAGFVLTRQDPAGTWGAATYALVQDSATDAAGQSAHGANGRTPHPMGPMPDGVDEQDWYDAYAQGPE